MNSDVVMQTAEGLARRAAEGSDVQRIQKIYNLALGRSPTDEEIELGAGFVKTNSWGQYAQVILMTNEFLFVD
jgi:hypothetical protein